MSDDNVQPAAQEEINVAMPEKEVVYYDTVLETTMTVHEVTDDFVTYVVEDDVDNVHSDPRDQFLAWLAAERFVKLGDRNQEGKLIVAEEELGEVFGQMYGLSVEGRQPKDIAAAVVEKEIDERIGLII